MKRHIVIPAIYFLIVLVCLLIAFDYDGYMRSSAAWLVTVALTLPWSVVSIIFMWALFHGAGLEFFTIMYLAFAAVNAYVIYRMALPGKMTKFLYGKVNTDNYG
ncbi:MAG: hypothetical protein IPM25_11490 [Chloracidobacterium sp.]|nr:hypothetical protein [Chloracidobacterium sp.]